MLHQLTRFFKPSPQTHHAYALYSVVNEDARKPLFFGEWGVPDTLDGRFEMILLHMFLYLHTLKEMNEDTEMVQRKLIEAFFDDMDRSLREYGIGDTGVGKRIKNMANAFYGRINAFEKGLKDEAKLHDAIKTNIYGTAENIPDDISMISSYIHKHLAELATHPLLEASYIAKRNAS